MAGKGVVIEFDFAVLDGAKLLFETTKAFLDKLDGIRFDKPTEARFLAGEEYVSGLTRLFSSVKTKKTPQKAARELPAAFCAEVGRSLKAAAGMPFRNFVNALTKAGVEVVIFTRADLETAAAALAPVLGELVSVRCEPSDRYGAPRGDTWLRACRLRGLRAASTLAVTGSGFGVKAALRSGMSSLAVVGEHAAYQDFGGAAGVVGELSGVTARKALEILGV